MQVALKDLEIRGAGNLLGGEQSGHIAGVGFDLYLRMIGEAVNDFKGIKHETPAELKLELPIDAHIPATYVDSERLRLEAYHKLSAASNASNTRADLDKIKAELEDRYGVAPQSVSNLIDVIELRQAANRMELSDVLLIGQMARIAPIEFDEATQVAFTKLYPGSRYLLTAKNLSVPTPANATDREMIDWTWALLEQLNRATKPQP
jgi:transcription-repair coupling factor (superfamily II helicase)